MSMTELSHLEGMTSGRPVELDRVTGEDLQLRGAYGTFPSGVTAVCGLDGGQPVGFAASAFTAVSLDPAIVSVCVRQSSATWPQIRRLGAVGISVLAAGQDLACRSLASSASDRFADIAWVRSANDAVLVEGAAAWLDCEVEDELTVGDHLVVCLRVRALALFQGREPLVFHGSKFRTLEQPDNEWAWTAADLGGWGSAS